MDFPIKLPPTRKILYQSNNQERMHLLQKLRLGAFQVSVKFYKAEEFTESLSTSIFKYRDNLQRNNMSATLESGSSFQVIGKLIHFKVRKVAKIRNRYNQVPYLTQDITWESDKNTSKHHPTGDLKQ